MLDFLVTRASLRLNAFDTFFDFAPRKTFAKAQIHREQNSVRPEVHGKNALDRFDGEVGLHQAADVVEGFAISAFADEQALGFIAEERGDDGLASSRPMITDATPSKFGELYRFDTNTPIKATSRS
jgi:hypothetical protein